MMKQLLMLVLVTACLGQRETRVFTVTRTLYSDKNSQQEKVADLSLITDKQYGEATAEVQLVYEHLVDPQLLQNSKDAVVLHFKDATTGKVLTETIRAEDLLGRDCKEVLSVVTNGNYDVLAINYSQQRLKRKELPGIEATVHKNLPGKDYILTYVSVKKPGPGQAPEDQSFFAKYKWYIIGFFMLLFMMSKADPEAMQQQMQGRQATN